MTDIYDDTPSTEMDVEDLVAALRSGRTTENAAQHLAGPGQLTMSGARLKTLGC
jgi:hypothetical protein